MNTIKCRVRQNEYQDIGKKDVTPAEALLLRAIHDGPAHKAAKEGEGETPNQYWGVIRNAVASGEAQTVVEDEVNPDKSKAHKRTTGEELARLRRHYPVRSRDNAKVLLVDELFPGLNPQLPETFSEIGLQVASPEEAHAAKRVAATRVSHGNQLAKNVPDKETPDGKAESRKLKAESRAAAAEAKTAAADD